CQQAAEKHLKAFLVAHGVPFDRVHNLVYLLDLCVEVDARLRCLAGQAALLTPVRSDVEVSRQHAGALARLCRRGLRGRTEDCGGSQAPIRSMRVEWATKTGRPLGRHPLTCLGAPTTLCNARCGMKNEE
ncbi:MAG: HEPN domain-containing protein, partial [Pirellulaceae bacterium]